MRRRVDHGSGSKHDVRSYRVDARFKSERPHDFPEDAPVPVSLLFGGPEEEEECNSEDWVDPLIKPDTKYRPESR